MKKLLVFIFLGLFCSLIQSADADKAGAVEDGVAAFLESEFEKITLDPQLVAEALRFELGLSETLEKPENPLQTTTRQHQLTVLNFTLKNDHAGLFEYMKAEFSKVDKDFWHLFTPKLAEEQRLKDQWANLTFEEAQKIAYPFCQALSKDFEGDPVKAIGEIAKGKSITPQGIMLTGILVAYRTGNKEALINTVATIAKWTSDKASFNLMNSYFRRQIDQANGLLKAEHLSAWTKPLLEIGLDIAAVEGALQQYEK